MNITGLQVSEYPEQPDRVMLITDLLSPRPFGPEPRPGIDVVRLSCEVAKGTGADVAKKLCAALGLDAYESLRVEGPREPAIKETVKVRRSAKRGTAVKGGRRA